MPTYDAVGARAQWTKAAWSKPARSHRDGGRNIENNPMQSSNNRWHDTLSDSANT